MRRTATGGEVCQQALSPLVSLPFVARGVAHDGRGVAHGDRRAALAAVASHVFRLPQGRGGGRGGLLCFGLRRLQRRRQREA